MGNSLIKLLVHPHKTVTHDELHAKFGASATSAAVQGWREYMEDCHVIDNLTDDILLAGVFDGHGGPQVANFVAQFIANQFKNQPFFSLGQFNKAITKVFKRLDEMIGSQKGQQELQKIRQQINPHQKQRQVLHQQVGSTANIVLLTPTKIYIANLGDSRSVLCRNGQAITLSQDHKPNNSSEKARIIKAGGQVSHNRINGSINISRTFGDFQFKSNKNKPYNEQMIIPVPQIKELNRCSQQDQYIIIASDGVWQKFGNNSQQLIDQFNQFLIHTDTWKDALREFLLSLIPQTATESETGYDNMTMILIRLQEMEQSTQE